MRRTETLASKRHENAAQPAEELGRVRRRPKIGPADDLDEGHAAAVVVEAGEAVRIRKAVVQRLARILFHVYAPDPDAVPRAGRLVLEEPVGRERLVVLRDLVALRQVGIEVVLAGEDGGRLDRAAERERGAHRQFDRARVQDRQRPGQTQADRTDVGVRRRAEPRTAGAEDLGRREELRVNLETDDRFIHGQG
jgi:hypothetical protein